MAAVAKKMSKTFVWILMGLLMVGLAGFGAVDMMGSARTVATVGDETISVDEYYRELQREISALQQQTGQGLTPAQARELGLDQLALSRLVALAALDHEVAQLGVSLGDENLQQEIVEIPAFQGVNGGFDREAYRFAVEQAGLSESEFEDNLRKESARTLVQSALVSGVSMPDTFAQTMTDYVGARRSFTVATLGADQLQTQVSTPTDTQISDYYEANIDQFTLPRTKRVTYALLSPEAMLDEVEVDEESIRNLYETREAEFNQPARRLVERLVFSDDEAAQSALAQIEVNGTTFEKLVEDRGLTMVDVDLGDLSAAELGDAADGIFAAEIGAVVGPLPSDLGPALYRINGTLEARETPFEEVESELRDELAAARARRLLEGEVENLNDLLAGGATLEELRDEAGTEVGQIDWTEESSDGVAAYDGFRAAASNVQEGDFPEIDFLEDGSLFALRLDEVLEPRPEPLEQSRESVIAAWQQAETEAALAEMAQATADQLEADGDFTATGLPVRVENGLTRTAFLEGTPPDFMTQVFEMEPGELRVISGPGQAQIVRLDEVLPPEETDELNQMRQALGAQMDQTLAQNLFDAFVRDAQTRSRPTVDQQALTAVHANF
ncbi:SurA N-terminal domain-containing protein [Ruegeria sp. 2205SS24-7]|uniref:peptidyl-prolyl cis-trans isomerase n=1 Tax=Ruegeria discodermiae TaxID=3064389 RepID=UPI00274153CD|nr:peptidyl-prolyl cis-trans isomerase [Ruegeria sp. 2205SS24-7]MDP5216384.1 SurA N-terminal domain-containing protein [Ruegeria sp. 2205SS24-7]